MSDVATNTIVDFIVDEWNDFWFNTMKQFVTFDERIMKRISANPNVTLKIIAKYPNELWQTNELCANSNFSKQMLIYRGIYNQEYFGRNPNLTIIDVLENRDAEWNWNIVSMHPNITENDVENNLNLPWNFNYLTRNKNITTDFYNRYINRIGIPYRQTCIFSRNVTMNFIDSNPIVIHQYSGKLNEQRKRECVAYNWQHISSQVHLTIDYVKLHRDYPWSWHNLSANKSFTMLDIQNNMDLPWEQRSFALNENLTFDMAKKYIQHLPKGWLCENPFIVEKRNFVEPRIAFLLVITIYEFYQQPIIYTTPFTNIEHIFFETYFVQHICKY